MPSASVGSVAAAAAAAAPKPNWLVFFSSTFLAVPRSHSCRDTQWQVGSDRDNTNRLSTETVMFRIQYFLSSSHFFLKISSLPSLPLSLSVPPSLPSFRISDPGPQSWCFSPLSTTGEYIRFYREKNFRIFCPRRHASNCAYAHYSRLFLQTSFVRWHSRPIIITKQQPCMFWFSKQTQNPTPACLENGGTFVRRVHENVFRLHVPVNHAVLV